MPKPQTKDPSYSFFRVDLRRLILWMCLFFVFLALGNSLFATYQVQHRLLLQHSMDRNHTYAEQLAAATAGFIRSSAQMLEAAALDITQANLDPVVTHEELTQVASVSDAFNTLIAVDASGRLFASLKDGAFPVGAHLQAAQTRRLLDAKDSTAISAAFKGPSGRWLSMITRPLYSEGQYAGFIGGAVHLQSGSALQNALHKLHDQDGAYFYIIDDLGTVVHHPDHNLIGTSFLNTAPVPAVLRGEVGTQHWGDDPANDRLISYAPVPLAHWGVVVQRPTALALSGVPALILQTLYYSLPLFILSLLAIWWLARMIAHPLRELAEVAGHLDNRDNFSRIRFIKSWYVEAALIRKGLMQSFSAVGSRMRRLHREGSTDPLTGLLNRRGLDTAIEKLSASEQSVGVVTVDIDHFKAVNDQYGHAVGDEVLKAIAALMTSHVRGEDVIARTGGEEFVVLLPATGLAAAGRFAERLRVAIAQTAFDEVGTVTVSLGIASHPGHGIDLNQALVLADAALYRAKKTGRNRVHLA